MAAPDEPREVNRRRAQLRKWLNHPITDNTVAALIVFSVIILLIEVYDPDDRFFHVLGWLVSFLFAVELCLRFAAERRKSRFFANYWIDILSVLPLFYPDFGALRALRLLRLFRLGPLMAQSNRRIGSIFRQTIGEQLTILTIIGVVVVLVTLALVTLEPQIGGVENAFWASLLSMVAGEPIGLEPRTFLGKILTLLIMMGGLTVFALLTGTVSAVMAERLQRGWTVNRVALEDLEGHIVVCGWNRSALTLLSEFRTKRDVQHRSLVIVAETRPALGAELDADPDAYFVEGDYTKVDVLERCGVRTASTAILMADSSLPNRSDQDRDARTVLAGLMIEKLNPQIFTCAELLSRENETHLRMAGIEEVVIGDEYSATILATSSRVRGVTEIADEIFSNRYGNQIYKKEIKPEWAGKTVLDLQHQIKFAHDSLLIAVEKSTGRESRDQRTSAYSRTITNPPAHYQFQPGDMIIFLAKEEPKW